MNYRTTKTSPMKSNNPRHVYNERNSFIPCNWIVAFVIHSCRPMNLNGWIRGVHLLQLQTTKTGGRGGWRYRLKAKTRGSDYCVRLCLFHLERLLWLLMALWVFFRLQICFRSTPYFLETAWMLVSRASSSAASLRFIDNDILLGAILKICSEIWAIIVSTVYSSRVDSICTQ